MIPILYAAGEFAFDTNGIGMLPDIGSVKVEQELNGMYELTLGYPRIGLHAAEIADRSIIMVKPDPVTDPQPFRIYRINPVSAGTITAYARHLAYDMSGIVAAPFTANSAADAMVALPQAATSPCLFTFETDKDTAANMSYPKPRSLWRTLGGSEGSILDTYGGEYEFDRYKVKLWKHRGMDRGVTIRYGKNLRTLEQDRNCAEVYTGCYPYWYSEQEGLVELPDRILQAEGTYAFERIYELDLSSEWQEKPTTDQLEARARKWMKDNDIGIPKISWKIEFLQLEQTEEYKEKALLERVLLGDTVHVIFPEMGVNVSSRVVRIDYDPVNERYNSITLGRVRQNLADTIIHQQQAIEKKPDKQQVASLVTAISSQLSDALTGALGGAVRLLDTDGDGMPDELYIADNPSPAFAKKVWRFNYMGWAASKQGYNGPWEFGATLEEGLLAAFVTVAHLTGGTIQSKDGESFFIDLDNGIVRIKAIQDMVTEIQNMGTDMSQMEQRLSSQIDQTAEGIRTEVSTVSTEVRQEVNQIYGDLNTANDRIDGLGNRQNAADTNLQSVQQQISSIEQTSKAVNIEIKNIQQNGVDKVITKSGYRFADDGLHINRSGDLLHNKIDHKGLAVVRGDGPTAESMLVADDRIVDATNLHARTYLIIGQRTRIEDYEDGGALFLLGE